jgi:hypothetical protein
MRTSRAARPATMTIKERMMTTPCCPNIPLYVQPELIPQWTSTRVATTARLRSTFAIIWTSHLDLMPCVHSKRCDFASPRDGLCFESIYISPVRCLMSLHTHCPQFRPALEAAQDCPPPRRRVWSAEFSSPQPSKCGVTDVQTAAFASDPESSCLYLWTLPRPHLS